MKKIGVLLFVISIVVALPVGAAASPAREEAVNAQVTLVSTVTVSPYQPFQEGAFHVQEAFTGSMGTYFVYYIDDMFADMVQLVGVAWNPGAMCGYDSAQLKVTCSSATAITFVTIDIDMAYTVSDYTGNVIWMGWAGNYSGYTMDYTIALNYPSPLVYLTYYGDDAPVSITPTQITWHKVSATTQIQMVGYAAFSDARVYASFLPIVVR
ncbi:MAG TPA: hypothetical protein PKL60_08335 [Anaerolineaceae bacterium]|nr:hypothetical protein [Anaerolineaceae bacterium]